jgi:hypothetical protein
VQQVDAHSDHKPPPINVAGKFCVIDADGRERASDTAEGGLYYRGPCDNGSGK